MRQTVAVAGLGFGDEGKGSIVDYLTGTLRAGWIIRANGGAQAGHNVVRADGRHHTFAQFGAGSFHPYAKTWLSRFFFLDVIALRVEAGILARKGVSDPLARLHISSAATVLTPMQQTVNRLRELARGENAHGTCGLGIGEAFALGDDADLQVRASDLRDATILEQKLARQREYYLHEAERLKRSLRGQARGAVPSNPLGLNPSHSEAGELLLDLEFPGLPRIAAERMHSAARDLQIHPDEYAADILQSDSTVLFEGAQGMLLDRDYGFWPHVTPSSTGFTNPLQILREHNSNRELIRMGVARTYATRHGAGPLPTEIANGSTGNSGAAAIDTSSARQVGNPHLPEPHNGDRGTQGVFRTGWPDLVLLEYAIMAAGGIDALALTHADRFTDLRQACRTYDGLTAAELMGATREERTLLLQKAIPCYETCGSGDRPSDPGAGRASDHLTQDPSLLDLWKAYPLEIVSHGPGSHEKAFYGRPKPSRRLSHGPETQRT